MSCSTYRYKHTHEESLIEARHEIIKAFCSLIGVTGLTGQPDRSDRSKPANYNRQIEEERISVKHLFINICFKRYLMGSCTTCIKKILAHFHFISYSCALWQRLWNDLLQFLDMDPVHQKKFKTLMHLINRRDQFTICIFETNIFFE